MHASTFTIARTAALPSSRRPAIAAFTVLMAISNAHRFRQVINAVNFGDLKLSQNEHAFMLSNALKMPVVLWKLNWIR